MASASIYQKIVERLDKLRSLYKLSKYYGNIIVVI
jgi:hypothetical protein